MSPWRQVPALMLMLMVPSSWSYVVQDPKETGGNRDSHYFEKTVSIDFGKKTAGFCQDVLPRDLRQIFGSAYNDYYMSFEPPKGSAFGPVSKRERTCTQSDDCVNGTGVHRPFFVEPDLREVLSDVPAWKVGYANNKNSLFDDPAPDSDPASGNSRIAGTADSRKFSKRSVPTEVLDILGLFGETDFKWHCDAPLRWKDLGPEYFPRYVLSVDCNHFSCKGNRFKCEPRAFSMKVLRKKVGACAVHPKAQKDTLEIGSSQMPNSLRQVWVWEIRAIPFCCVCQYN